MDYQDPPQFPPGTPEYDAYDAELREELAKFAAGEEPYPYPAPGSVGRQRMTPAEAIALARRSLDKAARIAGEVMTVDKTKVREMHMIIGALSTASDCVTWWEDELTREEPPTAAKG